jgi:DNA-binding MarR family transcriptional regulator
LCACGLVAAAVAGAREMPAWVGWTSPKRLAGASLLACVDLGGDLDRQTIMAERSFPGQVADGLRALSTEIDRLDQAAADRYGLNRTDMRALDILGRAGPLAPTALARLLGFTTGGVTTVLDRLEKAGYIRRRPDPGDRRRQLVETTQATAARDEEVFGDLIRATRDLLADYTDHELLVIRGFLDRVRQVTAAHADALGGHARPGPVDAETTGHGRG